MQNTLARDCVRCASPIDPERLDALPQTEYCTACQVRIERRTAAKADESKLGWPVGDGDN